jgi:hypothetical protein
MGQGVRAALLTVLAAALSGCAAVAPRPGPVEYLDRDTAVTFTVVASPLIFARVRPDLAARVRDYATVAAASLELNGETQYVLLVYLWSTVDPRNETAAPGPAPDLVLTADDRRIALRPLASEQPLPPVDRPPTRHFVAAMYRTDLSTLQFLSTARYLSLLREDGGPEARFRLWRDERQSLTAFVRASQ